MIFSRAIFALVLFTATGSSQSAFQPGSSLQGEVTGANIVDPRWQVELRPLTEARIVPPLRVHLQPGGVFQFHNIESGTYHVILLDPDLKEIKRELTSVTGFGGGVVQIRLPSNAQRAGSGAISVKRLAHKVPKDAVKEFERARGQRDKGKFDKAESHYKKALEIDPDFLEAANDLGALHYRQTRYADAIAILERARALDADAAPVLANLSAALMASGRPAEAEPLARRATILEPNTRSRYLLGMSRAWQQKFDSETRDLLEGAAESIPHARLTLARMFTLAGDLGAARSELQKYLAAQTPGPPQQRTQIEAWLKSLR